MKYDFDSFKDSDRTNFVRHNPRFLKSFFGKADLLPFWVADTDFEVLPALTQALVERAEKGLFAYETKTPNQKNAVSNWYKTQYDVNIHPKSLLFTPSVNTSIALILEEFTEPDAGIIIQPPVYQAFASTIDGLDRKVINNPLIFDRNNYQIDFEDLKSKMQRTEAKILLLCSPHNPVGRVWRSDELKKIAQLCIENDILLISDEIHGDVVFSPNYYLSMLKVYEEYGKNMIMISSPGKSFGIPGLIDSFISSPNKVYIKRLHERIEKYHLGKGNAFSNTALEAVYTHGADYLEQMTQYIEGNVKYIIDALDEISGVGIIVPEGTYQVWLDFREMNLSDEELADFLVNSAGLAMNQGFTYGEGGSGFARMNIACPRTIIENAMAQLKQAVEEQKKDSPAK
jgi:cystathionine beta-lyase